MAECSGMSERILVVGPSWVGDMVMAQSLFKVLAQRGPETIVDVLAPAWSRPIIERMPEIRRSVDMPLGHGQFGLRERRELGRSLRGEYEQAIVLPRSWKSALVPHAAKIPLRTGFHGEQRFVLLNDRRRLDKQQLTQTVQRFVSLGLERDAPLPPTDIPAPGLRIEQEQQQRLCTQLQLDANRPAIAFMAGAEYGPAKRWPTEHFAQLGKMLAEQGMQAWVFGAAKEAALGEQIATHAGTEWVKNLCGKTQLADAVDLVAMCRAAVCNDSGLMHVAAACGVPVVGLYGSSSADFTPPLTEQKAVVSLQLDCAPCFERECPLGHTDCLQKMSPTLVHQHLMGFLS